MLQKLLFSTALIALIALNASAQSNFDFETLSVPEAGYWNGSDESGSFGDADINFPNNYNTDYGSWDGFSYSTLTDVETAGYGNQYSTFAGEAYSGTTFGLGYPTYGGTDQGTDYKSSPMICAFSKPAEIASIRVTNSTYAALSIRDGDDYNSAFTTDDGDYFKLLIEGKKDGVSTGIVEFFLADYTGASGTVVNTWKLVDLSSLGTIDALEFSLVSTNYGDYGMTNPAYFCFDDIVYTSESASEEYDFGLKLYPNPAQNMIFLNGVSTQAQISLYNISGKLIAEDLSSTIDVSNLKSGVYFLNISENNQNYHAKFIKQ